MPQPCFSAGKSVLVLRILGAVGLECQKHDCKHDANCSHASYVQFHLNLSFSVGLFKLKKVLSWTTLQDDHEPYEQLVPSHACTSFVFSGWNLKLGTSGSPRAMLCETDHLRVRPVKTKAKAMHLADAVDAISHQVQK